MTNFASTSPVAINESGGFSRLCSGIWESTNIHAISGVLNVG
jgi:hypothetical protein